MQWSLNAISGRGHGGAAKPRTIVMQFSRSMRSAFDGKFQLTEKSESFWPMLCRFSAFRCMPCKICFRRACPKFTQSDLSALSENACPFLGSRTGGGSGMNPVRSQSARAPCTGGSGAENEHV